jgi:hypothetical protein
MPLLNNGLAGDCQVFQTDQHTAPQREDRRCVLVHAWGRCSVLRQTVRWQGGSILLLTIEFKHIIRQKHEDKIVLSRPQSDRKTQHRRHHY